MVVIKAIAIQACHGLRIWASTSTTIFAMQTPAMRARQLGLVKKVMIWKMILAIRAGTFGGGRAPFVGNEAMSEELPSTSDILRLRMTELN